MSNRCRCLWRHLKASRDVLGHMCLQVFALFALFALLAT
jgi:hypothetical protein